MHIDFDPYKDAVNRSKHGVSLALASLLEWDSAQVAPDTRRDYGELRFLAFALHGMRLYAVTFVDRGETRRIISLRKANHREVKRYAEHDQDPLGPGD